MKYKVLIKRCDDPQRGSAIAHEVARWSGSTPDVVYNAIMQKAICIRKEADEDEAQRLGAQFGAFGAEVELIPLIDGVAAVAAVAAAPVAAAAMAAPAASAAPAAPAPAAVRRDDDDDDDDEPGRILTDAEYSEMIKQRPDVFRIEKEKRTTSIQAICMLLALGACFFMMTRTVIEIATDFFEKLPEERTAKILTAAEIDATLEEQKKKEEKKEDELKTEQKKLTPQKNKGASGMTGGGGDPRARVTQMGVLGIVSGQIKGKSVASADIFGKGGFASDIDAILSGVGGLKSGGDGGVGRKGVAGIGYGSGYGSGFGGSGGGLDDILGGLMGGGGGGLDLKKRGELKMVTPDFMKGGTLTGGRSKASINRVVMQNMAALRHAYNRRLRDKPGMSGKITVKFSIDEFGRVIFAQIVETTIGDSELEGIVVDRVRSWNFDKIDKPGDVTEVTYPFMFSQ